MQQVRAPADLSTTLDEDYGDAVVRLSWAVDRQSRKRLLLCAAVELLPREIPPPVSRPERTITASSRFRLYARDIVVSARRGLTWFEDSTRGIAVRPNDNGSFCDADDSAARQLLDDGDFQASNPRGAFDR